MVAIDDMVSRLSETRGPYSQRRRPANAHPDTQTYRNNRAVFARDRLVVAGNGARTIGADIDQRFHCGDLLRYRRTWLGTAGDADRELDVEAVIFAPHPKEHERSECISKDEAPIRTGSASWFETRARGALLTMRVEVKPR